MLVANALAILGAEVVVGYKNSTATWASGKLRRMSGGCIFVPDCRDLRPFVIRAADVAAASFRGRWIELEV